MVPGAKCLFGRSDVGEFVRGGSAYSSRRPKADMPLPANFRSSVSASSRGFTAAAAKFPNELSAQLCPLWGTTYGKTTKHNLLTSARTS